jgi:hypothetical protein
LYVIRPGCFWARKFETSASVKSASARQRVTMHHLKFAETALSLVTNFTPVGIQTLGRSSMDSLNGSFFAEAPILLRHIMKCFAFCLIVRRSVNSTVRETLALDTFKSNCRTFPVCHFAGVPLEIPFR